MPHNALKHLIRATNSIGELIFLYVVTLAIASTSYSFFEGKPFFDALWWSVVTATTTGYGDMFPVTTGGRVTGVVLMHFTLFFILPLLIARIIGTMIEDQHKFTDEEQKTILSDLAFIKAKLCGDSDYVFPDEVPERKDSEA
jgi:voltage-gated potassium channel